MKKKLNILLYAFIVSFTGIAQTIIPDMGNISGNWTLSGSPYVIQGRAIIPVGQTLTISPGVQIKFASSTAVGNFNVWSPDTNVVGSIHVLGKIVANGTPTDTIGFSSNGSGYWGCLIIPYNGDTTCSFQYCKFQGMNQMIGSDAIMGGSYGYYHGLDVNHIKIHKLSHLLFENNNNSIFSAFGSLIEFSEFRNNNVTSPDRVNNSIFDNSPISVSGITAVNCIILNASTAISISSYTTGRCILINSTIYNNQLIFFSNAATEVDIYNSIFLNNVKYDSVYISPSSLIEKIYNCVLDGNNNFRYISNSANIFTNSNSGLVNPTPTNGDFHLLSSSVCINIGDTTTISQYIPTTDLDGNPRYVGLIDIGPYEYHVVSIENFLFEKSIKTYPNPTSDILTIEFNSSEKFTLTGIRDMLGNDVMKARKNSDQKVQIDVSGLKNGIYFLNINQADRAITEKVIIQH